jgi:hypothetical protein
LDESIGLLYIIAGSSRLSDFQYYTYNLTTGVIAPGSQSIFSASSFVHHISNPLLTTINHIGTTAYTPNMAFTEGHSVVGGFWRPLIDPYEFSDSNVAGVNLYHSNYQSQGTTFKHFIYVSI